MQAISLNQLRYINSTIRLLIFVNIIGCNTQSWYFWGIATFLDMSKIVGIFGGLKKKALNLKYGSNIQCNKSVYLPHIKNRIIVFRPRYAVPKL